MIDTSELNLRHLLDSRRYLLFTIAVAVLALLLLLFGFFPQISAAQSLFQKRSQELVRLQNLQAKSQELETMTNSPLMTQMYTVDKVLPSKKPLLEMLSSLNLSAREAGVAVTSLEITPGIISTESATVAPTTGTGQKRVSATKSKVVDTLTVELSLEGEVGELNSFFELAEKRAPLSTITSISLTKKGGFSSETGADLFTAQISVTSYFFVQSVTSSIESSLPKIDEKQQQLLTELRSFLIPEEQIQREIQGGGLNDLFGVEQPLLEESL